jgi:hypothetical protein
LCSELKYTGHWVQSYLHCDTVKPKRNIAKILATTDAILYTVRHPIDRILSWYRYVHPYNCQLGTPSTPSCQAARQWVRHPTGFARVFFTCFATVADWAYSARRRGMYANGTAASAACRTLARQALRGNNVSNNGLATHLVANYEHYINRTIRDRTNASVMIIRTEQLWTDLPALDKFLKGTGDFGALQGSAHTHGSERSTNSASSNATLNITAIQTLCCVLQSELYWYRALVESAVNLNSADREATVQATRTRCGWDSWEAMVFECPQIVA